MKKQTVMMVCPKCTPKDNNLTNHLYKEGITQDVWYCNVCGRINYYANLTIEKCPNKNNTILRCQNETNKDRN